MKGIKALKHIEISALFYGLLDTSQKAIIVASMDGTIVFFNKKTEKIFGYHNEDLEGQSILSLIPTFFYKSGITNGEESLTRKTEWTFSAYGSLKNNDFVKLDIKVAKIYVNEIFYFLIRVEKVLSRQIYKLDEVDLKEISASIPGIVFQFRVTREGIRSFMYVSDGVEKMFGFTPDYIYKNTEDLFQLIHPEDLQNVETTLRISAKSLQPWQHDFRIYSPKDNAYIWFQGNSTPSLKEDGSYVWNGTFLDITYKKKTEESLHEVEQRLHSHFHETPLAVIEVDIDLSITRWNPSAEAIFGYSKRKAIQNNILHLLFPEEDKLSFESLYKKLLKSKDSQKKIFKNITRKLQTILCEWYCTPYFNKEDEIAGLSILVLDITKRNYAEETLKLQSAYFQQLFDASPFGIVMLSIDGRIISVNKSFEKIFQYTIDEATGVHVNHLLLPDPPLGMSINSYKKPVSIKKAIQFEAKRKRRDDQLIDVLVVEYPIIVNNKPIGIYGIYADITPRKEYERQLQVQNAELKKANEELDRFVYSASHDLRAPLTSVLGLINILELSNKDMEGSTYLNLMRKSVNKLDGFIKDIINYSRNSRLKVQHELIDFKKLVQESYENFNFIAGTEKINFLIEVNDSAPFYNDKQRINILLNNLISNSIKYHRLNQEEPYIKVKVNVNKKYSRILIEDNGEGISKEYQQKVFEMFYRASERSKGSGLGLYIVKEIINKLEGKLKLVSKQKVGTRFYITIPNSPEDE